MNPDLQTETQSRGCASCRTIKLMDAAPTTLELQHGCDGGVLMQRIVRRHLWGLVQCDDDCGCGQNSGLWFVEDYRNPNIEKWMNGVDTDSLWRHIVYRGWHLPPNVVLGDKPTDTNKCK